MSSPPKVEEETASDDADEFVSVVDTEADTLTFTPAVTPPPEMLTMKPPKPADFTGEERDSETVDMFFHQLDIYLRLSNVADADKMDIASMFLKG